MKSRRSREIKKLKNKYIGNTLIIIGIICVIFSIYQIFKWQTIQNRILEEDVVIVREARNLDESYENEITSLKRENLDLKQNQSKDVQKIDRNEYVDGMIKLEIQKLKVKAGIMSDTTTKLLKQGPGLYNISSLPAGDGENVLIAGHRTTYGAWFRNIDKLEEGDQITLDFNHSRYLYKVEKVIIIAKNDWSVTEPTGNSVLTLTSCHPIGSAEQRIVVRATLENIVDLT